MQEDPLLVLIAEVPESGEEHHCVQREGHGVEEEVRFHQFGGTVERVFVVVLVKPDELLRESLDHIGAGLMQMGRIKAQNGVIGDQLLGSQVGLMLGFAAIDDVGEVFPAEGGFFSLRVEHDISMMQYSMRA